MAGEMNFGLIDNQAVYKGAANTNALLQQFARTRAGQALAAGDKTGAIQTLQRSGALDDASQLQVQQNAQDDRLLKMEDKHKAESAQMTLEVAGALANVRREAAQDPDGGKAKVMGAFDQLLPIFQAKGAKPEELAMYRAQLEKDPDTFLTAIAGKAKEELFKFQNVGNSLIRTNQQTGAADEVFHADPPPKYMQVDPTKDLVQVGGAAGSTPTQGATHSAPVRHNEVVTDETAMRRLVSDVFPGVKFNGGARTPERNKEVGGVANSYHLSAQALDIDPASLPPGTTKDTIKRQLEARGIRVRESLEEYKGTPRHHFHVAWDNHTGGAADANDAGQNANGMTVLRKGVPKPAAGGGNTGTLWTPQQVAAAGLEAGTVVKNTNSGPVVMQRPRAAAGGGKPGGGGKLSPQDGKFLGELRTSSNQAKNMLNLLTQFQNYNREVDTGGMLATPGAAAVMGPFNSKISRMSSITSQLTPAMRNGLPGAASDKDVAMFRDATVSIGKPREANDAIVTAAKSFAQRQGDYVAYMEQYAKQNGNLLGAQEKWNAYVDANPLFTEGAHGAPRPRKITPWRQAIPMDNGSTTAPQQKHGVYDPALKKVVWQ